MTKWRLWVWVGNSQSSLQSITQMGWGAIACSSSSGDGLLVVSWMTKLREPLWWRQGGRFNQRSSCLWKSILLDRSMLAKVYMCVYGWYEFFCPWVWVLESWPVLPPSTKPCNILYKSLLWSSNCCQLSSCSMLSTLLKMLLSPFTNRATQRYIFMRDEMSELKWGVHIGAAYSKVKCTGYIWIYIYVCVCECVCECTGLIAMVS